MTILNKKYKENIYLKKKKIFIDAIKINEITF